MIRHFVTWNLTYLPMLTCYESTALLQTFDTFVTWTVFGSNIVDISQTIISLSHNNIFQHFKMLSFLIYFFYQVNWIFHRHLNTSWQRNAFVLFCVGDSGDESDASESEEKSSSESETEKSSEESSGISSEEEKVTLIFIHCCLQFIIQRKPLDSILTLYWTWYAWLYTIHIMSVKILVWPKSIIIT